jgi:sigma-E factor negative regulatory protein RseA
MEKLSQLMDGELGSRESKGQIKRLEDDPSLAQSWETFHLIRDALRHDDAGLKPDFGRRLHERLQQEPVVIAPHTRLGYQVARYTLPLAAGIAGVTAVAWLALSLQPSGQQAEVIAQRSGPSVNSPSSPEATAPAQPIDRRVTEYLTAHQEFSPRTAMQGVASYVRTVAADDAGAR